MERYIPANKRSFRFLSPSVTTTTSIHENWQENGSSAAGLGTHITGLNGAANGFDVTTTNNASMFGFNHDTGQWAAVTNTNSTELTAGTPYRLMVRGDRTISLATNTPTPTNTTLRATGNLFTGNFTPTLNQAADGYSFIGNPYQAPVDLEAVLSGSTNMNTDVVYYWDPTLNTRGGYVTRTISGNTNSVNSDFTEVLQPGQAVFVKKDNTVNAATLTLMESHKVVGQGTAGVFRASTNTNLGLLRVNLQANVNNQWETIEGAVALFDDAYSWNATAEDAIKFGNLDEEVSFMQNNTAIAIAKQTNPSATNELPIRLRNTRYNNYQWEFEVTNYNGLSPYLFDTVNNTYTQIANHTVVPFTVNGQEQTRFKIVFQTSVLSAPDFTKQIALYPNPSKVGTGFYITGIPVNTKVELFSLLGQSLPLQTALNGSTLYVQPMGHVGQGVYVVQVTTNEGLTQQVKWIVD
jgi:hypothetical protein